MDELPIVAALKSQQQCDEDGVMCIVSRQACDEAAALIRAQHEALAKLEGLLDDADSTEFGRMGALLDQMANVTCAALAKAKEG